MKKNLLLAFLLSISITGFSKIWTISNSGVNFTPQLTTIVLGDTVNFLLGSTHNAIEVSAGTYEAGESTPLPDGFQTPMGGGMVLPSQLGIGAHYFVCSPHVSLGMKARIIVLGTAGIANNETLPKLSVFPNPAIDLITVKGDQVRGTAYSIIDEAGRQVLAGKLVNEETTIVINQLAAGMYFFQTATYKKETFAVIKN